MIIKLDNFWLRIIAVAMALILWVHVATEEMYDYQITLPVVEVHVGDSLALVEPPPDSLTVVVSATGKQLLRSKWRERGLRINAATYRVGRYETALTPANTSLIRDDNVIVLDKVVIPAGMNLVIDYIIEKTVPVVANLITTPDDGFAVSRISKPEPSTVRLVGPRSLLRGVDHITTEPKHLQKLRNNLTLTLPLAYPEGYKIVMEPDSVSVTVTIAAVKTRIFKNVPIVVYNSPGNSVVRTNPAMIEIELTGPPADIDLLNRNALVASVDFRQLRHDSTLPIKIDCPTKFTVKRSSDSQARLATP
ncbi:MAG: YbbR-like domain-containing protein [Candidatus Zixiibacteriota bacterium]